MPSFARWVIGGLIGGLAGAAVWAAVTHFTNYEIGWIAWGVGIATGFGVRMAAGDDDGNGPGLTAVLIAVLALVAGKYMATVPRVNQLIRSLDGLIVVTAEDQKLEFAKTIATERERAGKKLKWPPNKNIVTAEEKGDFPADVWKEAEKRWNDKPAETQQAELAAANAEAKTRGAEAFAKIRWMAFQKSFGPIDILFFFLAIGSAYKLGSGLVSDD